MNSVLLFRTDRVGDFLLSLSLIKIIKKNYPNSKITVVASEMNYKYISSFNEVHEVIILKNNLLSKISLTFKLRNKRYDAIIVHDGKNRSRIVSLFSSSIVKPSGQITSWGNIFNFFFEQCLYLN